MSHPSDLEAIHRPGDGELVGYVSCEERDGGPAWIARALFGGELRAFAECEPAVRYLRERGLAVLAETWWYRPAEGGEPQLTFLIEAQLGEVTVRFGYDPDPANLATLRGQDLDRLNRDVNSGLTMRASST